MNSPRDPEAFRRALEAKLEPEQIRATLAFAGLYQIAHELIKQAVLDEVRGFFWLGIQDGVMIYDEPAYAREVLRRAPKNRFLASLSWLVVGGAVTSEQADRLELIVDHRHELTHELLKYIFDPDFEPNVELLTDALDILKSIRRFWTGIEADIGTFDHLGDVDLDAVAPLSLVALQMCIDAYVQGPPSSG